MFVIPIQACECHVGVGQSQCIAHVLGYEPRPVVLEDSAEGQGGGTNCGGADSPLKTVYICSILEACKTLRPSPPPNGFTNAPHGCMNAGTRLPKRS